MQAESFLDAVDEWCIKNSVEYEVRYIRGDGIRDSAKDRSTLAARLFIKDIEGRCFTDVARVNMKKDEAESEYQPRVWSALSGALASLRHDRMRAIKRVERDRINAVRDAGRKRLEALA